MADDPRLVCKLAYRRDGEDVAVVVSDKAVVLGRAPGSDLVLSDESVSRSHARIRQHGNAWIIEDLGSKNGVKVNTYRTSEQQLVNGDRIDVGAVRLYVDIRPLSATAEARVVFDEEKERGLRTEVIDMQQLGSMLSAVVDEPEPDSLPAADRPPSPESNLLPLFSEAAEALISVETLKETLERILALVFNNLPVERGVICLYDEQAGTTEPKVMRTREGVANEPISISSNIANDVIQHKQALLVQDTMMDERYGGADSVILMNIKSAMCAPLYRQGRITGFIYVDRQTGKHPFSATHLQTLSTLAVLSAVAVERTALREEVRYEQDMRSRLARYSSPAVVDRIIEASDLADRSMVAEEGDITVLFADLTGFTAMAESLPPSEVVQLLNMVFERLTEVVFEFDGTLDKFRGDGMMAFFGAPLAMEDHARRAVDAALRMQEMLTDLNAYSGAAHQLAMRVGINSGTVVVGDIGSPQRKDYTVIGDVVNVASRFESSVARPGQVVIGPHTFDQLGPEYDCVALDETTLKGKAKPVRPYLVNGRSRGA